jgi:succinate dehydrogenase hydrophobic anchor subunit
LGNASQKPAAARRSVWLLNVVLGVVLCAYSMQLVWEQLHSPHRGHDFHFHLVLGLAEAVAALLFLIWQRPAGIALLLIFVVAALFHLLSGQVGSLGGLAIYFAAVLTVMNNA